MDIQALVTLGQTCQGNRKLWWKTFRTFHNEADAAMKLDERVTHVGLINTALAQELDRIGALIAARAWEPAFDAWEAFLHARAGAQMLIQKLGFVPLLRCDARADSIGAKLAGVRAAQIDYLSVHVVGLKKKRTTRGNPF